MIEHGSTIFEHRSDAGTIKHDDVFQRYTKFGFINGVDNVNWPPYRDSKETESLYGGQFTLSTPLIKPNFVYHFPTDAAPQFL